MAAWSDLFPDMMGRIHGCPAPLVENELRRAAIDFFRRSRVWKVMLDPILVPANTAEFDLMADVSTQFPVRIEKAWNGAWPLAVYTAEGMDADFKDNWMTHQGQSTGIVQMVPNSVRLYPIPVSDVTITARISVSPSDTATLFPDEYLRYRRAFTDGALAELMSYEGEVWSNPERAEFFRERFEAEIGTFAAQAAHAFGRGRVRSRPKLC